MLEYKVAHLWMLHLKDAFPEVKDITVWAVEIMSQSNCALNVNETYTN